MLLAYGQAFRRRVRAMGIRDRPMSPRSPWQNPYAERLIGTLRRDCLDHVLIFGARHLRRIQTSYSCYYNETRTHLSLDKDAPLGRAVQRDGTIVATPILSGLHHCLRADMIFGKDKHHGRKDILGHRIASHQSARSSRSEPRTDQLQQSPSHGCAGMSSSSGMADIGVASCTWTPSTRQPRTEASAIHHGCAGRPITGFPRSFVG